MKKNPIRSEIYVNISWVLSRSSYEQDSGSTICMHYLSEPS